MSTNKIANRAEKVTFVKELLSKAPSLGAKDMQARLREKYGKCGYSTALDYIRLAKGLSPYGNKRRERAQNAATKSIVPVEMPATIERPTESSTEVIARNIARMMEAEGIQSITLQSDGTAKIVCLMVRELQWGAPS